MLTISWAHWVQVSQLFLMTSRMQQVPLLFLLPPQVFLGGSQAPWLSDSRTRCFKEPVPCSEACKSCSTMVTNPGVGIHLWGAIGAGKRALTSQSSCLHVPGSTDPEVGTGIFGCCDNPMEELVLLCKGQVLKGHQKDRSVMVRGPGSLRCQWQGGVMQSIVTGMPEGHLNQSPLGFWMGGQECREELPDYFHPHQPCPCCLTHTGVYGFAFKPLQMQMILLNYKSLFELASLKETLKELLAQLFFKYLEALLSLL